MVFQIKKGKSLVHNISWLGGEKETEHTENF